MDWLFRGGVVHLLHDEAGKYAEFGGELGVLNSPVERLRVGAGWVLRHAFGRRELSAEKLPAFPVVESDGSRIERIFNLQLDSFFINRLKALTRPEHAWWLIYTLSVVYLRLIGPVNFLIGRRIRNYRLSILFLTGAMTLFAVLFFHIGRRGYGEKYSVHTITYARPLADGYYDVSQWSNIFVTASDRYMVKHDSAESLYDTVFNIESVEGAIHNGANGFFQLVMPLYSHREFTHRGRMKGIPLIKRIVEWEADDQLRKMTLEVDEGFPVKPHSVVDFYNGMFYDCQYRKGHVELARLHASQRDYLELDRLQQVISYGRNHHYSGRDATHEQWTHQTFMTAQKPLITRGLALRRSHVMTRLDGPGQRLQLFVYADSDEPFAMVGQGAGREIGRVLYHLDLFKPRETTIGTSSTD